MARARPQAAATRRAQAAMTIPAAPKQPQAAHYQVPLFTGLPTAVKPVPAAKPAMTPTDEQAAIIDACRKLRLGEAIRVQAYAGSGKTSTLRLVASEGFGLSKRGVYLAFNREIAAEAKGSFPASVTPRTSHSLAWGALGVQGSEIARSFNAYDVMAALSGKLADERASGIKRITQAKLIHHAITGYCQSAESTFTDGIFEAALDEVVYRVPDKAPETDADAAMRKVEMARRKAGDQIVRKLAPWLLDRLLNWRKHGVQISHDIYLKAFQLNEQAIKSAIRGFDYVMLDEAQDLAPVQIAIAQAMQRAGVMLVAVGDSNQAIYGWRGAHDALRSLPGQEFHLSQSFRFGNAIAQSAWQVLQSKPRGRPTVMLRGSDKVSLVELWDTDVAAQGKSVSIVGGLVPLVDEVESVLALMHGDMDRVRSETIRRFQTFDALKEAAEHEVALAKGLEADREPRLVADVSMLRSAHRDAGGDVLVSSGHRSKGREWDVVALRDWPTLAKLDQRFAAASASGRPEAIKLALEEYNLLYVAATRAVRVLRVGPKYHDLLGHGGPGCKRVDC